MLRHRADPRPRLTVKRLYEMRVQRRHAWFSRRLTVAKATWRNRAEVRHDLLRVEATFRRDDVQEVPSLPRDGRVHQLLQAGDLVSGLVHARRLS